MIRALVSHSDTQHPLLAVGGLPHFALCVGRRLTHLSPSQDAACKGKLAWLVFAYSSHAPNGDIEDGDLLTIGWF